LPGLSCRPSSPEKRRAMRSLPPHEWMASVTAVDQCASGSFPAYRRARCDGLLFLPQGRDSWPIQPPGTFNRLRELSHESVPENHRAESPGAWIFDKLPPVPHEHGQLEDGCHDALSSTKVRA
jgi:hypothetical protein